MILRLVYILLLCGYGVSNAQNLVPNGSFEEYFECPDGGNQLETRCVGWTNSRGSCEYFNVCGTPCGLGIPCNVQGWQEALDGEAYAGFVSTNIPEATYREQMTIELIQSLETGVEYYFSMYVNNAIKLLQSTNKASNGQGAWLTTTEFSSSTNPSPILNSTQVLNLDVVNDSTNWVQIKGSFIADSAYTYLVIGGFLDSANIEVVNVSGEGPFENNGEAYYFVDEVRLSTDSVYAFENLTTGLVTVEQEEFRVFPNPFEDIATVISKIPINEIRIYNSQGFLVANESGIYSYEYGLDLDDLDSGIYYIELFFENNGRSHHTIMKR